MPNRIVRPGILSSDRVDALTTEAEVFYRRLMSKADDYGRFDGDWRVLRSELFPLRTERISQEQIEVWLAECIQLLPGEDEPLIIQYFQGRKRYLQITNFGQPIRSQSKFPGPDEGEKIGPVRASASNCEQLSAYARATETHSHSHTQPHSETDPNTDSESDSSSAREGSNGVQAPEAEPAEVRLAFEQLAEHYPVAGRTRLKRAFGLFRNARQAEQVPIAQLLPAMLAGLERWQRSELWQAGKVHWLGNWLDERLWLERPLAASEAVHRSRAGPASKREQGLADFRRRMEQEIQERGENGRFIHGTGPG